MLQGKYLELDDDDDGLTRGTLVVVLSDTLSSVTLVSLTLSTEGCLWKNLLVLQDRKRSDLKTCLHDTIQ